MTPDPVHRDANELSVELAEFAEDLVVERHLIAADGTPVCRVERQDRRAVHESQRAGLSDRGSSAAKSPEPACRRAGPKRSCRQFVMHALVVHIPIPGGFDLPRPGEPAGAECAHPRPPSREASQTVRAHYDGPHAECRRALREQPRVGPPHRRCRSRLLSLAVARSRRPSTLDRLLGQPRAGQRDRRPRSPASCSSTATSPTSSSHTDLNCLSVLQFAVDVLKVEARHRLRALRLRRRARGAGRRSVARPDRQLAAARAGRARRTNAEAGRDPDVDARIDRLCELNVIEQVPNVCADDDRAGRVAAGAGAGGARLDLRPARRPARATCSAPHRAPKTSRPPMRAGSSMRRRLVVTDRRGTGPSRIDADVHGSSDCSDSIRVHPCESATVCLRAGPCAASASIRDRSVLC